MWLSKTAIISCPQRLERVVHQSWRSAAMTIIDFIKHVANSQRFRISWRTSRKEGRSGLPGHTPTTPPTSIFNAFQLFYYTNVCKHCIQTFCQI